MNPSWWTRQAGLVPLLRDHGMVLASSVYSGKEQRPPLGSPKQWPKDEASERQNNPPYPHNSWDAAKQWLVVPDSDGSCSPAASPADKRTSPCSDASPARSSEFRAGLSKPTGPFKSVWSGSGLSNRFDQKLMEIGQIQNQIQNCMFNRFRTAYRSVWLVTGQIQFFFFFDLNKCLYNIF